MRSEKIVALDRGGSFLAVASPSSLHPEPTLYPSRIIDAESGRIKSLGSAGYVPGVDAQTRYQEILSQMPPEVQSLAEGSLLNPKVSGEDRVFHKFPNRIAGAAHEHRAAMVFGPSGAQSRQVLRLIDCRSLEILLEVDLSVEERGPIPTDRGVVDIALDGDGRVLAMSRAEMQIGDYPKLRIVTTFHDLSDPSRRRASLPPSSFHLETIIPLDNGWSEYPKLAWCEGRWLLARPWQGRWTLLALNSNGNVVDTLDLDEPPMLFQAAPTAPRVAMLSESDVLRVVDLDSREIKVHRPEPSTGYPAISVAPDGSWVAFHDSGSGRVEAWRWDADSPRLLDALPMVELPLENGDSLRSVPGIAIGNDSLLILKDTKPFLYPLPF